MTDSIGELKLCPEGQRLYDEYCKVFDDDSVSDDDMLIEWDAYYNHMMVCENCGFK